MKDAQNVYWMFSAAAQAIGAFVAFILAAYALVQGMMDAAAEADETLVEIHEALKAKYHRQMSALVIVTAAAIVACLAVVYLNGYELSWLPKFAVLAALLVVASIVGAVLFVIMIIDPRKYRKTAQKLAVEVRPAATTSEPAPRAEFFVKFVDLERMLRELWERRAGGERLSRRQGPPGFREMVETLVLAEALPPSLRDLLLNVSRYRNLVFHGQVREIDPHVLQELDHAHREISQLLNAMRAQDQG